MNKRVKFTLSLLSLLLAPLVASSSTWAGVSSFYADLHSARWNVESSVFECRLEQTIPQYGKAVFYHQAGEPLAFYLQTAANPMGEGRALLTSLPPNWRHELPMRDLGYVDVVNTSRPVNLDDNRSRLVLAELNRGMIPTVMRQAWYSENESIHVGISPVNFQSAYKDYVACVAELLPVNFRQIERSTVFWQVNQRELDEQALAQLDDIIRYTKADPQIYSFEINGFTDGAGTRRDNLELSRIRAFAVHDYLVENGIDESMLATRYFGSTEEYRIVRNERSDADRDRNRRVTLLIRRR